MKLTLDNKSLTDVFFEDAHLFGIMAPAKDYFFCWQLNRQMHTDFRKNNELEIELKKKGRTYFFSVYDYEEPSNCVVHYLYNNKCDGEYLLPEFKHLDYLWLIRGDDLPADQLQHLLHSIRAVQAVQLVVELTNEKIKHKEHLIF